MLIDAKIMSPSQIGEELCLNSQDFESLCALDLGALENKSYLELGAGSRHTIVSGHDIERWLLKTAKAAAVSKNFARGRERLSGVFSRDEAILDMLNSPRQWPDGAGLYCVMNTGDLTVNHRRFQFQPLTNDQEEIEALALNILGLRFAGGGTRTDHQHWFDRRKVRYSVYGSICCVKTWTRRYV
jgi:hypothetical protein